MIGYVDDITFASDRLEDFLQSLRIFDGFVQDFALAMNILKSALWGSDPSSLAEISRNSGFPVVDNVQALGSEWSPHKEGCSPFQGDGSH